ncbi:hypothetical protein BAUCODRAFT_394061 [Baudoinia panamericana UAMH 10762]|uniref:Protein phosphatase 4 core regulatory subunit R2 n=1 Tax=Baudoinia panamericana (strain UAMH 10762) TaxID=717646 RepID=M2LWW0_BAUPA|nr:uncharacterized protein BAUCODRAFT_394061 [Baudoinia panamericana UAMH 10762]EMC99167.1 hypothetical protein BAUCODRAFT_394061 [Baudoinia panamericana UAMH 10762]
MLSNSFLGCKHVHQGVQIVYSDFPIPSIPLPAPLRPVIDPEVVASTPPPANVQGGAGDHEELPDASIEEHDLPTNSQSSTKENDAPVDIVGNRGPVPGFQVDRTHYAVQPPDSIEPQAGTLPPDLLSMYQSSTRLLERDFSHTPPYTIQRLAELVIYPKKHYRFLPAYLRALDRIVSVTSPVSEFPLPAMISNVNGGFLTNGDATTNSITEREGLGSDESLGGALLTPIPWLRNNNTAFASQAAPGSQDGELRSEGTETVEGPNGAGSVETVSVTVNGVPSASSVAHTSPAVSPTLSEQSDASTNSSASESTEAQLRQQGGVTQGELLRQEQEAGVVPVSQSTARRSMFPGGPAAAGRELAIGGEEVSMEEGPPEETPHARGPDLIGMEDMGPQPRPIGQGFDIEAAMGRARSPPSQPAQVGSPPPMSTQQQVAAVQPAPQAEVQAEEAEQDQAGAPAKGAADVAKENEKMKEEMIAEKHEEAKDANGDVVVADADGRPVGEVEKGETTDDLKAPDATKAMIR